MPDAFLDTATTNFDKSVVPYILRAVQETLRGGTRYTPKGSVIGATLVPGSNGVFRSFGYDDLSEDGDVSIEDGQADPDVEDLGVDYVEFTGTARGRTIGITDNAQARSPHNLKAIGADKVSRDIAVKVDNVARALYKAGTNKLWAGSSNTHDYDVAAGDIMTADLLKNAVALLRDTDVKPLDNGLYAFVAGPRLLRDLFADSDFVDEMRHADPATFLTGQVAKYAGAAIIDAGSRGIVADVAGTASIDLQYGTLIGKDSIFAALGGLKVIPVFGPDKSDPLGRRDLISWKGFVGGILNDIQTDRYLNIVCATSL